jgi:3-oxoacyl-[acyl-carrier-protein] synthase-3
MNQAVILSAASHVPEHVLPNRYFDELLGENVSEWLETNVQIYERRWCREGESVSDLCLGAAHKALQQAGVKAEALDLIIVATDTPEYISPSTASKIQYLLGARKAGTFDMNSACAGFVTALDTAAKFIQADAHYQKVLVIGAYAMSRYLNHTDKKTVTLFADGAGAFLLGAEKGTERGFLASQLMTQGQYHDWMGIYAGASHQPTDAAVLERKDHQLKFIKKFPPTLNAEMWEAMAEELSRRTAIPLSEVAQFFFTQLNINSIFDTMERLGQPREKAHTVMHRYGYTGSACIPMAFADAWEKGLIKPGDPVFFIGSGGGLAFASAAFRL